MKRLSLVAALLALAAVLAACSSASGAAVSLPPADPNAPVVVAQDNTFSPAEVKVTADKALTLRFENRDNVPHNVAVFTDASASTPVSVGEIVTATSADQQLPALAAGSYFFRCDVHKEMTGSIVAE